MNLNNVKKIYMIGIKGVGMTMLAQFLQKKDFEVFGSDTDEIFMTDEILKKNNIKFFEGFDINNIPHDTDLIIYSTAYNAKTNKEVEYVLNNKKLVLTYAEALGLFFNSYFGIAVAGTHGKTTTSAWLAFVLKESGKSPNALIGANVPQFGGAGIFGYSDLMVVEADEYQNKLKYLNPKAVLINNIDYDHPDYFLSKDDYDKVFIDFLKKVPKKGFVVVNNDDETLKKYTQVNTRAKVITYAINEVADYTAYDIRQVRDKQYFKVKMAGEIGEELSDNVLGDFVISLSGNHNVYNALAVIAVSIELNVELHEIREHLENFKGTARRMEFLGEYRGAKIIDDYAHHPVEIKTTLDGARKMFGNKKIRVVFHPHTFTRTKGFLDEFSKCFIDVDEVIVLDIYGSAREEQGGVHSKDLTKKIEKNVDKNKTKVKYIATLKEVEEYLKDTIETNEIIILMGAGDVFRVAENLLK